MPTPALLRGVDLAALAAALTARLRASGVSVSASGSASFVEAFRLLAPQDTPALYWAARLALVNRMEDLPSFDAVMREIFGSIQPGDTRNSESVLPLPGPKTPAAGIVGAGFSLGDSRAESLPWVTRTASAAAADSSGSASALVPDLLPSRLAALADDPFDNFDPDELRLLGDWLQNSLQHWPQRRSMRFEPSPHGKRIDLRATMNVSRSTGWETLTLARTRPRHRPRQVVLVCDVSRSMRPFATVYLHLMRAAMRQSGIRPEVFAFSTSLTRLTAVLSHRSAELALEHANATVTDRYGGTHIGRSLNALLASGPSGHANALRGAVVIIASDGWDSDPPEVLGHAMARLRRRAHRVVWLNPRAAQPDFQPLAGSMAAALPYCDLFLPANTLSALQELFTRPILRRER